MTKFALIFLTLAIVSGAIVFGGRNSPRSVILDGAFIASVLGYVATFVAMIVQRASAGTRETSRSQSGDDEQQDS